jgi:hypothetical protein
MVLEKGKKRNRIKKCFKKFVFVKSIVYFCEEKI